MTEQGVHHMTSATWQEKRAPRAEAAEPSVLADAGDLGAGLFNIGMSRVMDRVRNTYWLWKIVGRTYSPLLDPIAAANARAARRWARRTVPAYAAHLSRNAGPDPHPPTSKATYVLAHDHAKRCRRGTMGGRGTMVDESSGSTGRPMNWVRSEAELKAIHRVLANYIRLEFGAQPLFCINAFSMGAWATGVNFTLGMRNAGIVKSVGPDIETVIATLEEFGPGFDYLVTGYPPFLKQLVDAFASRGFPAHRYRMSALVAGEAMTEAMRSYLETAFAKVRSGYGASDVQIGIGGETRFSVWLRQKIAADPQLRASLLGEGEERCPMIFQYNPFETFIENTATGELLFTTTGSAILSPKPRYNLGDEGLTMPFAEALRRIRSVLPEAALPEAGVLRQALRMPLLFLYGRSDSTVSVMGANIYPQDVEHGLYADAGDARLLRRFMLEVASEGVDAAPALHVELAAPLPRAETARLAERLAERVTEYLASASRDYANALGELEAAARVRVLVHAPGAGPFSGPDGARIKRRYVLDRTRRQ